VRTFVDGDARISSEKEKKVLRRVVPRKAVQRKDGRKGGQLGQRNVRKRAK